MNVKNGPYNPIPNRNWWFVHKLQHPMRYVTIGGVGFANVT